MYVWGHRTVCGSVCTVCVIMTLCVWVNKIYGLNDLSYWCCSYSKTHTDHYHNHYIILLSTNNHWFFFLKNHQYGLLKPAAKKHTALEPPTVNVLFLNMPGYELDLSYQATQPTRSLFPVSIPGIYYKSNSSQKHIHFLRVQMWEWTLSRRRIYVVFYTSERMWNTATLINKRAVPTVFVCRVWSRNTFRVSGTETIGVPL